MKSSRNKFFAYAGVFILISLIIVLALLKDGGWKDVKLELIKDLIQLSLIVIIGGILFHEYTIDREKDKKLDELKKELYFSMMGLYFKVKKIRRILDAGVENKSKPAKRKMLYPIFKSQIDDLSETQLDYESHRDKIVFFLKADGFRNVEIGHRLKNNLDKMESYLNDIVEEYQGSEPDTNKINLSDTSKMDAFIFNTNDFKAEFTHYHRQNSELFLCELLNLKAVPTNDKATGAI